jgi:hypothetical protein
MFACPLVCAGARDGAFVDYADVMFDDDVMFNASIDELSVCGGLRVNVCSHKNAVLAAEK